MLCWLLHPSIPAIGRKWNFGDVGGRVGDDEASGRFLVMPPSGDVGATIRIKHPLSPSNAEGVKKWGLLAWDKR